MIYTLISLLILFWIVGLVSHIGGDFVHTLLVLAVAVFIFNIVTGRGARV
ncbi:lmo0937 family membrane protein [bacterium]|nr:lmo0937 family membrane protein [bacterium]MBP9810805.1 lmo0937 family membrane protein [bacterium]MDP3510324.1 lmo0937 family membrane protein [Candidatus Melainabacteria bacterium]